MREKAWAHVRSSLKSNLPCYGWELVVPAFNVIFGYVNDGYYVSGPSCAEGEGPVPWRELGDTGIGVVQVRSVKSHAPAGDRKSVREALAFACDFSQNCKSWTEGWSGLDAIGLDERREPAFASLSLARRAEETGLQVVASDRPSSQQ